MQTEARYVEKKNLLTLPDWRPSSIRDGQNLEVARYIKKPLLPDDPAFEVGVDVRVKDSQ